MKRKVLIGLAMLLISCICGILLCACGEKGKQTTVEVELITLNRTTLSLYVGDEFLLEAAVSPEDANQTIKWRSGDESIVTVDNGRVRALGTGLTYVMAESHDGKVSESCTIEVSEKITDISLDKNNISVLVGEEEILVPIVTPPASAGEIIWTSEPAGIVSVTGGKVTGLIPGEAVIKAGNAEGDRFATCNVQVFDAATDIVLTNAEMVDSQLKIGLNATAKVDAVITPETAMQGIIWSSSDESVATVIDGTIQVFDKVGSAVVTVVSEDGKVTKQITVIAYDPSVVENLSFERDSYTVTLNDQEVLSLQFDPITSEEDKEIIYTSSNQNIAQIDSNGVVTPKAWGKTVITAEAGGKQAVCEIYVSVFADSSGLSITYNEQDGTPDKIMMAEGSDTVERISTISTGSGEGARVYYAQVTFNNVALKEENFGTVGIGMAHTADLVNNKTSNSNFMFDKINSCRFTEGALPYGLWYRQGVGYNVSDEAFLINRDVVPLYGTVGEAMDDCFTEGVPLIYGIARAEEYVYTFINGIMIEQRQITESLKEKDTYPALYLDQCDFNGIYVSDIVYLTGDEVYQKIESAGRAFRYSRSEDRNVTFGAESLSATLTGNGTWWNKSVSPASLFEADVTLEFDIEHLAGPAGHIIMNVIVDPESSGAWNTDTDINGVRTAVAYSMWTTDNLAQINGVDVYPDTTSGYNDSTNRDYAGFAQNGGKIHVSIRLSMDESGYITSELKITENDLSLGTATKKTTKTYLGKKLSIQFLAGENVQYTISNFTIARNV